MAPWISFRLFLLYDWVPFRSPMESLQPGTSVLRWEKSHTPETTVSWRSSFRYAASIRNRA